MHGSVIEHGPGVRPGRGDTETREALAAEYALGTLRGPARRRFERLLAVDEELRARVRWWERHLGQWVAEAEPEEPPASVWAGIEARLGDDGAFESGRGDPKHAGWWSSLGLWRGLAVAATVALVLVASWAWIPGAQAPVPERVAVVNGPDDRPVWVLSSGREDRIRVRTLRSPGMGPDRVCPLWLQWDGGDQTRRVAILPEEPGIYTFAAPEDRSLTSARLAVSVEPADDVPENGPSGKVVFRGRWARL